MGIDIHVENLYLLNEKICLLHCKTVGDFHHQRWKAHVMCLPQKSSDFGQKYRTNEATDGDILVDGAVGEYSK